MIRFGRYELDATQGLTRGGQEVRLTAKSLAVLSILAERAGRVVTKDELFATLWADTAVTDSALVSCIQEIRHALDDDARQPRFIETLHRRGYRFVARTSRDRPEDRPQPLPRLRQESSLIGRDAEIEALLDVFAAAQRGARQICFITGEPGVGKTALLDTCLADIAAAGGITSTRAQCVEQFGRGEPYEPLLDSLMRLCRQPAGDRIVSLLQRYAPMWLVQLPGLLPGRQLAKLQRTLAGTSRDRMLRELANAIDAMAADVPLVLAIEDLHWSDPSTLDWIAAVAQRPEAAKLLIIATFRPTTPSVTDEPLQVLYDTLRSKSLAREVVLTGLDEAAVSRYLAVRFPPASGREREMGRLGRRVQVHTGGNPLFVATLLDQLVERGVIVRVGERWSVADDADVVDLGIPETIRPVIDRQIARLPKRERELLETASVMGDVFSVAAVASAQAMEAGETESTLGSAESQRFVREAGTSHTPDGTVSTELAFVHTLFRDALYQAIPRGRRVELHRRVAEYLEHAWGDRAADIAAELAVHFEQGRDLARAVRYLQDAAEKARRRSAFKEARLHYERAIALLDRLPDGAERIERELSLRMGVGAAIMAIRGFGAPEVEAAYSKARSLSQQIGDRPRLFPALWGLWLFYWGRGAVHAADELARELRGLAESGDDEGVQLQALHASWATAFSQGKFGDADAFAAQGIGLYDMDLHAPMAATYGSHDAGVCAHMFAARAQAFAGRVDEAIRTSDRAIGLARSLDQPFSIALSLKFRAALDQSCGDAANAGDHAAEGAALAREQGFALILAWCSTIGGWAAVRRGDHAGGLVAIMDGIAAARRSGSDQFQSYLHGMLADACLSAGHIAQGAEAVREALDLAQRTGERFYEAELHRLHGDVVLAGGDQVGARRSFEKAVELARAQGAAMLVLRAAIRLGRLSSPPEDARPGRELLRAARIDMPPGVRVLDIDEADALLEQ